MVDELVETVVPGGAWLAVGVALGASLGGFIRPAAKTVIKAGMGVADRVQAVASEAVEQAQDLVAEARHEREQERAAQPAPAEEPAEVPAPRPARGRSAPPQGT
jgi:Protein of unknown function (DUF5132)